MIQSIIGQKFGKLTVIADTGERNSSRQIKWLCKCDCGNKRVAISSYLKNGKVHCCSECAKLEQKPKSPKPIKNDLTGQQFSRLTVLYPTAKRTSDRCIIWHCKCKCGNECDISSKSLKQGNTKSCGCLSDETRIKTGQANKKDLTGQRFGKLLALEDTGERIENCVVWRCQCDCGAICKIKGTSLLHGVQSCGCVKSKGEAMIIKILSDNNIPFEVQKTFSDCIFDETNRPAFFDFYINDSYLIEYDGEQHFSYKNEGWNNKENYKRTIKRDEFKNNWCKENNIPLIRIPYTKLKTLTIQDLLLDTSSFVV